MHSDVVIKTSIVYRWKCVRANQQLGCSVQMSLFDKNFGGFMFFNEDSKDSQRQPEACFALFSLRDSMHPYIDVEKTMLRYKTTSVLLYAIVEVAITK
jgi:hypothetical protein